MMTTYPKRDTNNPEKTLSIPEHMRVMIMAREMDDGSKQIRVILGNQEIHLQKSSNYLEAMVNSQAANFSHYGGYREDTFEIYRLDGMIEIFSTEYENYVVYDGERVLLRVSKEIKMYKIGCIYNIIMNTLNLNIIKCAFVVSHPTIISMPCAVSAATTICGPTMISSFLRIAS